MECENCKKNKRCPAFFHGKQVCSKCFNLLRRKQKLNSPIKTNRIRGLD